MREIKSKDRISNTVAAVALLRQTVKTEEHLNWICSCRCDVMNMTRSAKVSDTSTARHLRGSEPEASPGHGQRKGIAIFWDSMPCNALEDRQKPPQASPLDQSSLASISLQSSTFQTASKWRFLIVFSPSRITICILS
jgi:hypothetical protein